MKEHRKRSTQDRLFDVSAELFARQGYASTSLDQIAKDVGIHKSTIFHYVAGKEDLLAAILDSSLTTYVNSLQVIVAGNEDPLTRLIAATRNHLDFVFNHGRDLRIFLRDRKHLSGTRGRAYLEMSEQYQAAFRQLIREGMAMGILVPGDPSLMCLFLLGSANWIVEWFDRGGRLTAEQVTEQFIESMIHNMLATK